MNSTLGEWAGVLRGSGLYKACVGRVVLLTFCSTYLLLLGNAAFALCPLSVALDRLWCDHDYPRWDGHNATEHTVTCPVLGAPASLIGSELLPLLRYGAPALHFPRAGVPNLAHLALSDRPEAAFLACGSQLPC